MFRINFMALVLTDKADKYLQIMYATITMCYPPHDGIPHHDQTAYLLHWTYGAYLDDSAFNAVKLQEPTGL